MSVVAIPPARLYFALLDAPVARGRARAEELGYGFEACLPCPLETVHAVYRPLADGRVLGIGLPKSDSESFPPGITAAHPQRWPEWAQESVALAPEAVNLLTGDAEPAVVRNARTSVIKLALIAVALVATVISVGIERRIRAVSRVQTQVAEETRQRYADALGSVAIGSAQPPAAIMTSELRRLRTTRQPGSGSQAAGLNADRVLVDLLSSWPRGTAPQTESVTIAERTVELVIRVPDLETAQHFVTALGETPGLTNASSSTAQDRDGIRLTIRLDREVTP